MRRSLAALLLLVVLLTSCLPTSCEPPAPPEPPPPPPPAAVELDVGLAVAERAVWRFTSEGSDLVPVDLLRAMKDFETGRLYIDSLDHYGALPSPASEANPYGLPVGWTTEVPSYSPLEIDFVGINCSACHSGQIEYQGTSLRIDGAPNMFDIEKLALSAVSSAKQMLEDPIEVFLFVARLVELEPPQGATGKSLGSMLPEGARNFLAEHAAAVQNDTPEPADAIAHQVGELMAGIFRDEAEATGFARPLELVEETLRDVRELLKLLRDVRALIRNRLQLAQRGLHALEISQPPGPGRDDPWGVIRNVLFGSGTELDAPTSIPALYFGGEFGWYHADGNTNSVMQRDIAQAVALGGFVDPATDQSSLRPRAIWRLEGLMKKLRSPAWPSDVLGPIDSELATRGEALFAEHCASCHDAHQGVLIALDAIGTDPRRAESFLRPQDGQPFHEALAKEVEALENTVYEQAGIGPDEVAEHEYNGPPIWRATGKYQSRLLSGVWSTAPYLHNGSVPSLYDLLLPVAERPATFQLGSREYDPERVGYVTSVSDPIFTFDITTHGGSNSGHEYGTDLAEADRWALVEYLKTL